MKITNISIDKCYPSPTNPRGAVDQKSESFLDLVASIKEKGVLVPVIARERKAGGWEIVAGNRRLAASKAAGLKELPADVHMGLDDAEAREIQIIENLHRDDVHPLEEGEAYRQLMEKSKLDIPAIAAKVGKSEKYVRMRLLLTDLTAVPEKAYREGKITDGHAILIARLESADQSAAMKYLADAYEIPSTAELREWIQKTTFAKLRKTPPWESNQDLFKAIDPCPECAKMPSNSLFGEKEAKQCADPRCYARKMAAFLEIKKREFAEKKIPLTLVSSSSLELPKSDGKKILTSGEYTEVDRGEKCESEHAALIVEGYRDIGKLIRICTDKGCKTHAAKYSGAYKRTEKEVQAERTRKQKEEAKEKAAQTALEKTIKEKIKLPLGPKAINALLEIMLRETGQDAVRTLVKAKGWEVPRVKDQHSGPKGSLSYEQAVRNAAEGMTDNEKIRLVFEGFVSSMYDPKIILKFL